MTRITVAEFETIVREKLPFRAGARAGGGGP